MPSSIVRIASLALLGPALLLASACGGGGDDDDDDGPPRPGDEETATPRDGEPTRSSGSGDTDAGRCEVRLTGDVEHEFTAPGGAAAYSADYHLSKDELRTALGFFGATPTDAELDDDIPDLFLLLLNCATEDNEYAFTFAPGNESLYSDFPFGPGEYVIPAGGVLSDAGKGNVSVIANVEDLLLVVSEPGEFNITEWDDDGIEGNFSFTMAEPSIAATGTPKTVRVEGDFNYDAP